MNGPSPGRAGDVNFAGMAQMDPQALAATLAALARGEQSLASLVGISTEDQAEIMQFAIARMRVGKNAEAARVMEGLVALDGGNPVFHEYLGLARERMADLDAALSAYDAHLMQLQRLARTSRDGSFDEQLTEGFMLRARIHARRGDMARAAEDLAQAASHDRGADPAVSQERAALERAVAGGAR